MAEIPCPFEAREARIVRELVASCESMIEAARLRAGHGPSKPPAVLAWPGIKLSDEERERAREAIYGDVEPGPSTNRLAEVPYVANHDAARDRLTEEQVSELLDAAMGIPAELLGQDEPMEQGLDEASALRLELEALRVEHAKVLVERDAFREALADRSRRR